MFKSKSAEINSACNYELQSEFKEHTIKTKNMTIHKTLMSIHKI